MPLFDHPSNNVMVCNGHSL